MTGLQVICSRCILSLTPENIRKSSRFAHGGGEGGGGEKKGAFETNELNTPLKSRSTLIFLQTFKASKHIKLLKYRGVFRTQSNI